MGQVGWANLIASGQLAAQVCGDAGAEGTDGEITLR